MTWNAQSEAKSERLAFFRYVLDLLRQDGRPRILDRDAVKGIMGEALEIYRDLQEMLEDRTVSRVIQSLLKAGALKCIMRDVYSNSMATPAPTLAEVAGRLREGAVVSLGTVLGESGIANNPSRVCVAVVPASSGDVAMKRTVESPFGDWRFHVMRDAIFFAGEETDRLDSRFSYPRATPERAFCDSLWFSTRVRSGKLSSPPLDSDLSGRDEDRLSRLVDAMGLQSPYEDWCKRKATADADDEFSEQVSLKLGF